MDNNKAIRKSAFITYRKCQKKFEFLYNDPNYWNYGNKDDEEERSEAIKLGLAFHEACENFFKQYEGKKIDKDLPRTFRNPFTVDQEPLRTWFEFFLEEETKRWINLSEVDRIGIWFPIASEIEVRSPDKRDRTGHIDRIDMMEDGNLCIVEYKTGKSYNMDNKFALTDMNQEIGFYATILMGAKVFPSKRITMWKVINPTLKKIWINSISPISLKSVDNTYIEINDKLDNKGMFKKNPGPLCDTCPYVQECLFGDDDMTDFSEVL